MPRSQPCSGRGCRMPTVGSSACPPGHLDSAKEERDGRRVLSAITADDEIESQCGTALADRLAWERRSAAARGRTLAGPWRRWSTAWTASSRTFGGLGGHLLADQVRSGVVSDERVSDGRVSMNAPEMIIRLPKASAREVAFATVGHVGNLYGAARAPVGNSGGVRGAVVRAGQRSTAGVCPSHQTTRTWVVPSRSMRSMTPATRRPRCH